MKKIVYKRIIGLFIIFAFSTIILCDIKTVNAKTCDEVVAGFNKNDTQIGRYGLSMDYDADANKYVIKTSVSNDTVTEMQQFDSSFRKGKVKFKIAGIYFYEPSDDESGDLKDKNDNIDLSGTDDISSRIDEFKSSGLISGLTISNNGTITISRSVFNYRSAGRESYTSLAVKLVPDGFNDPELVKSCNANAKFIAVVSTSVDTGDDMDAQIISDNYDDSGSDSYGKIDCNNYEQYDKDSFKYKFCEDKVAAVGADGKEKKAGTRKFVIRNYTKGKMIKYEDNDDKKQYKAGDALPFKCSYKDLVTGVSEDDSKYYVNKKYLYGEGKIKIDLGDGYQYTRDENGYKTTAKLDATCELKCEEIVKVEYGPPVASKAGLCFEYKVKVTSRVNCEMTKEPPKPPKQVVCTPKPVCTHKNGVSAAQGGPNEDFDNCVVSCDGGKYSDKCVNKCYKKVYGTSLKPTTGYEIEYADKMALGVAYEYKYDKNKVLIWDVAGDTKRYYSGTKKQIDFHGGPRQVGFAKGAVVRDSYWHRNQYWGISSSIYSIYDYTGIPKKQGCNAKCEWKLNKSEACTNSDNLRYLNHPDVYKGTENEGKSDLEKDKKANKEKYDELKKQCQAYASCNTTTAEFTISADYTVKGESKKTTIEFPFTSDKKATIENKTNSVSCSPDEKTTIVLHSDGCYNCGGSEEKKMYMTEWSFPGTWINNKTGKITYNPSAGVDGTWRKVKNKFCLPLNIANVNTKWYNYYQAKVNGNNPDYSYNSDEYINGKVTCPDGGKIENPCDYRKTEFTDEDKIDYNINATARKFGMYEWDIDISCFYAVNDIFPKVNENDKCETTCGKGGTNSTKMRVRSVDLSNLFPDDAGSKLTDPSKTGRTPGFNWTGYASQTQKDGDYKSTPTEYIEWVQKKGISVYSDEYLDYEVTLTKDLINEIKSKNKKYTDWEGKTEVGSVINYQSSFIRSIPNAKYPIGNAIECNNMKNYNSTECQEFDKEGK